MIESNLTDFGYQKVTPEEKTRRVTGVFSSVAPNYDLMNDLMSGGLHRFWKRYAVHLSQVRQNSKVLDVAGGTGDMAALFRKKTGKEGRVVISDINRNMLEEGRDRLIDKGIISGMDFVQADAENLPFLNNTFDCISIAFGLRNVTDKPKALISMYKKLKYGGNIIILEFSELVLPLLKKIYDEYSFKVIPSIGKLVAKDRESYQYLVESIRLHPGQESLKKIMEEAGFCKVSYYNMTGGVVALHKGYKL